PVGAENQRRGVVAAPAPAPTAPPIRAPVSGPMPVSAPITAPEPAPMPPPVTARWPQVSPQAVAMRRIAARTTILRIFLSLVGWAEGQPSLRGCTGENAAGWGQAGVTNLWPMSGKVSAHGFGSPRFGPLADGPCRGRRGATPRSNGP